MKYYSGFDEWMLNKNLKGEGAPVATIGPEPAELRLQPNLEIVKKMRELEVFDFLTKDFGQSIGVIDVCKLLPCGDVKRFVWDMIHGKDKYTFGLQCVNKDAHDVSVIKCFLLTKLSEDLQELHSEYYSDYRYIVLLNFNFEYSNTLEGLQKIKCVFRVGFVK